MFLPGFITPRAWAARWRNGPGKKLFRSLRGRPSTLRNGQTILRKSATNTLIQLRNGSRSRSGERIIVHSHNLQTLGKPRIAGNKFPAASQALAHR
jgi:hypothetical protein